MNILMTITDLMNSSGGPSKLVTALAHALTMSSAHVYLFALDPGDRISIDTADQLPYSLTLQKTGHSLFNRFVATYSLKNEIKNVLGNKNDVIIHNHGIWLGVNHMASQVARRANMPLVLSTHGMLQPWAMKYRKIKKRVAWILYQKSDLEKAQVLHATAMHEARNLRTLGLKQPIAVIPNAVDVPPQKIVEKKTARVRTILFLSRIHPVKGIKNLVDAWRMIQPDGWRVLIAGPDEGGHKKEVRDYIQKAQLGGSFEFLGSVDDEAKWDIYASADIFVLPSFSENFGIVIAEALACGVPVITTKATPWQELVTHNCGWWVDVGVEPLAEALTAAVSISDQERHAMGLRGKILIDNSYSWSKIASDMLSVYAWILRGGTPPACVMID